MTTPEQGQRLGLAGRLARPFLRSKLTPVIVFASILLGLAAVWLTPREEEPQIVVPMVDVMVPFPGASPRDVETQLVTPLERRLWGIPGVEYLYSSSRANVGFITVRFKVNEPLEPSLVKVHQELGAHPELLPSGTLPPVVRALTIDDVPFLTLTLHAEEALPAGELRKLAEEVARELADVPRTASVQVVGGARRTVRVEPDPARLRALSVSLAELHQALQGAQAQLPAGALVEGGRRIELEAQGFARSAAELDRVVVTVRDGRPIYVEDVARVVDGPEPEPAVVLTAEKGKEGFEQAVSIVVAKRPGTNATELAHQVLAKVDALRGGLIPAGVKADVTRNYGETAGEKSNELIEHLLIATLSVIALILLAMGWRSAVVVAVAVPVTLALTLLITYLNGYTLNRVTLFALIFSIGILVDDAIVVVENIHRHLHLPGPKRSFAQVVLDAVDEVGNPTILATVAVIAAILPMAMVRGLMGPYMRPIPVGASVAMVFSLLIAFVVSPWAAMKVFRKEAHLPDTDATGLHPADPGRESPEPASAEPHAVAESAPEGRLARLDRKVIRALLGSWKVQLGFMALVTALLLGAVALLFTGAVKVKMLPFDNKSEFQVQLDLPAGAPREEALALGQDVARRLLAEPEVESVQVHSGVAAPFTFVGMVRHSFMREAPEMVDLQVNLSPKGERKAASHAIAVRVRPLVEALAHPAGARVKVVEIPPGPPVLATMVAEIYAPSAQERDRLGREVKAAFEAVPGVVDVDSTLNPTSPKLALAVDREKAALHGVQPAHVVQTLAAAGYGAPLGTFHGSQGAAQVPVVLQLAPAQRTRLDSMLALTVPGARGLVPLSELVRVEETREAPEIQHKNLKPVTYVTSDLAGEIESPLYALLALNEKLEGLKGDRGEPVARYGLAHPPDTEHASMKWDGEWHITLEVFRDLGLAFGAVMLLIYVLMVGWFQSFSMPLVILVPIPLSLVGILPAHGLWGAFFTATSMIGFIAGAGIVVRNSIILVDFAELKLREGMPLAAAVEEAVLVRFRPMALTSLAVIVGSAVMLADPIFQGLAVALMAGAVASTLLSRYAVPVIYYVLARRGRAAELQREGARAAELAAAQSSVPERISVAVVK
ncbi:efflux RND transporter permease subunit [Anaeromyxobacter dehalogenans]|uniref:Acriflavin resistance protein n=1 Tax=Anaeromyxobacter dehalogenans (strain 2CP-C) TaxID=290397 RepID=Q2IGK2_ANADE|nr:efflux RND transporter permease subunit [Anaeromyxobacter dehalogenans]ABC83707.1 Acriflavin resistance protein [Anaeromyxobacter dehalogenans 2CP-C]